MNSQTQPLNWAIATIIFLVFPLILIYLWKPKPSKKPQPPEAAGAWPIIGHLPLLGGSSPPHITLGKLADKYGPIFTIRMGVHKALIVSNCEIAKECFTTNDKVFANRPNSIALEVMGFDNTAFGFSPYGPYWRETRKIAVQELLSNHRLQALSHIRESEVKSAIKQIYNHWLNKRDSVLVDMKKWFGELTLNISLRMIVGKRMENDHRIHKAIKEYFRLSSMVLVGDVIPWLRWLDFGGHEREMRVTAKEFDDMVQKWLDEHKLNRSENDFMGVMVSLLDGTPGIHNHSGDRVNKSTCLALILGATDTSMVTLIWALALLLNNYNSLTKVQQELDEQVGRERQVNESDLKNLVYLQAVLKETFRLYPAAPHLIPHEALEDCSVAGYHIQAGTRLLINAPKIHRDPNVWPEPNEFKPERFLTTHKDIDVRGKNYELIPFGAGRRICPGISFGLQVTQLVLASLIHGFEITTMSNEPVDMTEAAGLTNLKASPLDVLMTPRLLSEAY